MSAREAILERVRSAVPSRGAAEEYARVVRNYSRCSAMSGDERVALMIERLREYDAEVVECAPDAVAATIAQRIAASGHTILAAPPGLPEAWLTPACAWRIDDGLTHDAIEQAEGVVTAASCGIAESGTMVLHHGPSEGRRVLSLLPDWHLCVLYASQIVEVMPEYFARFPEAPRLATFIAGPSATADIEMTRIKGVHGPRFLNVIVVRDDR